MNFAACIILGFVLMGQFGSARADIKHLANSCMTCHSPQSSYGPPAPVLAGLDEGYFIQKMKSYRDSQTETGAMAQAAKGLTDSDMRTLADMFALQSRACPYYKKPADQNAAFD